MRRTRWVALVATIVLATAGSTAVASAQGSSGSTPAASDVGVTATDIHVAVVADVDTPLSPGLFQGAVNGVKAWAKYINANGGLAKRKVVVDFIDSKLSPDESRNAVISACQNDFALVGTSALFLKTVADIEGCADKSGAATGIPDIAVVTTEVPQQCSPTTFGINPPTLVCSTKDQHPQTYQGNAGRSFYYAKKYGKGLHGAFLFSSDLKSAENANRGSMTEMQKTSSPVKQDFEGLVSGRNTQSAYTPIVQQLKDHQSTYAQSGSDFNSTVLLRKEAKLQGITDPKFVWDCTLQCYNSALIKQGGADVNNEYVSTLFLPFNEASSNKTLSNYLKYVGGTDKADGFGAQAFASGLLFQQAVEAAVKAGGANAVTRKNVFDQLNKVTSFNAGGMIGNVDVASRTPTKCFALLQVQNGKFVRVFPTAKGTFNCDNQNLIKVKLDLIQ